MGLSHRWANAAVRAFLLFIGSGMVYICVNMYHAVDVLCAWATPTYVAVNLWRSPRDSMRNRRFHEITKYILIKRIAANIIYIFLVWINLWADQARNRNHSWLFFSSSKHENNIQTCMSRHTLARCKSLKFSHKSESDHRTEYTAFQWPIDEGYAISLKSD